ncbi:hypothetical protein GCM10025854_28590 [Tetragenococcus muriaticus]|nr:hypothetical protein GCM10025854_15140 [Tetragenococcus muriaticus]GMA48569.1 hypothetical protein GCM10025854_28190 [Tetragenococcus muriaticus]GMA48609.1 hypothetical protein GCM10025854_28590 [Tetragenococcus muriaticus]
MDGILPLWKERGMTSHDCVSKLRKILHTKKVGHGGTLDPDVDGILPICIGKATKVVEFLTDSGKEYEGEITLGYATNTEDAAGEVIQQDALPTPLQMKPLIKQYKPWSVKLFRLLRCIQLLKLMANVYMNMLGKEKT